MGLTQTQSNFYSYCDSHDYISESVLEEFRNKLEAEGNQHTLLFGLKKFVSDFCPKCGANGAFKFHFLGKLKHPDCGFSWYVDPGSYIGKQLKAVVSSGVEASFEMGDSTERRGEKAGCLTAIFGFLCGVSIRLPFALLMIPIQAVVSLTQQKPESGS